MEQKPGQQQKEKIAEFKSWKLNFLGAILNKTKDMIRNTNIRLELGVDEIKMSLKRAD